MQPFHEQRVYQRNLRMSVFRTRPMRFLAHWHDEAEYLFVIQGRQTVGINEQKVILQAGQILQIAPWDIHFYETPASDEPQEPDLNIKIRNHETQGQDVWMLIFSDVLLGHYQIRRSGIWTPAQPEKLNACVEVLQQIRQEYERNSQQPDMAELALSGLLRYLMAQVLDQEDRCFQPLGHNSRPGLLSMRPILTYIGSHYQDNLSRDAMAQNFSLSPAYFSRCFKALTSLTFTEYLTRYRLDRAAEQLPDDQQSITAIALACGFDNTRTFYRAFRKIYGCQPGQYRNRHHRG